MQGPENRPGPGRYTWDPDAKTRPLALGRVDYLRVGLRGAGLIALIGTGLLAMVLIRLVERPLAGPRRPVSPFLTQAVCRAAVRVIGLRLRTPGLPMAGPGAVVANHSSWLDILVLNAAQRITFVSKSEVASWPGIGLLARVTGTVFITRDRREAAAQLALFQAHLAAGHTLLLFPEGTSTDGRRVLPFKPTLFAAFLTDLAGQTLWVQPVTVAYAAPPGADPRFYGWWGGMDLAPHLLGVLAAPRHGRVTVIHHPAVRARDHNSRKSLAAASEAMVRKGLADQGIGPPDPAS